jgi:maleylpyruvate isomerase
VRRDHWVVEGERPERELSWVADGQVRFEQAVLELDGLGGQSRLPGWTRGHVVTHLARNAEALSRLLSWARTGIETPMYPSEQAREADIQAGAGRPQAEQLNDLRHTAAAFAAAAQQLSVEHWQATLATRQGPIAAFKVPWLRVRELWLHLVDLDAGVESDVIPEDVAIKLVRDVADWLHTRVSTRVELQFPGQDLVSFGPEGIVAVRVSGPVQSLAAWLTGRSPGEHLSAPDGLPELPSWI